MATTDSEQITETITSSNIDDIVETLYNKDDELIGYACKQVLEKNTVEPLELIFYMDVLTPKANSNATSSEEELQISPQEAVIKASQEVILREMSTEYQIDPTISRGVRCFDLPVDGSTWIVQMTIEKKNFREETLFGGCRQLEWDPETQDCKFYESRMKGSYMGAVATDKEGTPFSDAVAVLEDVIDGPKIVEDLMRQEGGMLGDNSYYETAFLGAPRVEGNPNFQGGADEGRDILKDPVNIKMGIDASQSQAQQNRKTITVVGGMLVACFSITFALLGYILFNRRRTFRRDNAARQSDIAYYENHEESAAEADPHYELDKGESHDQDNEGTDDGNDNDLQDDEPEKHPEEYPDLPMSAEAIQMDLGNALKGQLMGLHAPPGMASTNGHSAGANAIGSGLYSPGMNEEAELDDDSWAQTDGTIGSLDLQLEPITAEV